jgi:sialate O-acetylesterase
MLVWGWSEPSETFTVEFRGGHSTWRRRPVAGEISHAPAGKKLVVRTATSTLVRTNILVGEVWVASGQSNMEWPLKQSEDGDAAINASANDQIRLFTVPKVKAGAPADDVRGHWEVCGPGTVASFSAVAYHFGADLQRARRVPVGLINTSWGGSPAEVWIREEVLAADPDFLREILESFPEKLRQFHEAETAWEKEAAERRARAGTDPRLPGNMGASELYTA